MVNEKRVIVLVIPSLKIGGMERVCVNLANYFSKNGLNEIHVITIGNEKSGFELSPDINLHQPLFNTSELSFIRASIKSISHIRRVLKRHKPETILSFGDRYNSLVILSSLGTRIPTYVSNRMNPSLSNGRLIDAINILFYPFAAGIIAQTNHAAKIFRNRYLNKKIAVIPNPFPKINLIEKNKKKIILNVGRFGDQKNQHLLLKYFNEIDSDNWELVFLGDGRKKELFDMEFKDLKKGKNVRVLGFKSNPEDYYRNSSIFAFTSTSEGFPNALGEAMTYGCACISFDCEAGPSELIKDGENGFLVPNLDHKTYKAKLFELMNNEPLRNKFGLNAIQSMSKYEETKIANQFYDFILQK